MRDILVLGASAGGIEPLVTLVRSLPKPCKAAVFVVLHVPAYSESALPTILARASGQVVAHAVDGEPIVPGRVYVAPPDSHMTLHATFVRLTRGPRENNVRPSVNALFRSAARAFGRRVMSVVLSGALDDGTVGSALVKTAGGITIAQDPEEAMYPSMPSNVIANVRPDHILRVAEIGPMVVTLMNEADPPPAPPAHASAGEVTHLASPEANQEAAIVEMDPDALDGDRPGTPSAFSCPECGGVLWELDKKEPAQLHFRCRTGHAYGPEALLASQANGYEEALWAALRSLRERAELTRRLLERAKARNQAHAVELFTERLTSAEQHVGTLQQMLQQGPVVNDPSPKPRDPK